MKRAHLHSQTMGVISIVLSLIAAGLAFPPLLQTYISLMSSLGSIGYGLFWFLAGFLAPGMGSTGIAKKNRGSCRPSFSWIFLYCSGWPVFVYWDTKYLFRRSALTSKPHSRYNLLQGQVDSNSYGIQMPDY